MQTYEINTSRNVAADFMTFLIGIETVCRVNENAENL